jgi:hypothetical protein
MGRRYFRSVIRWGNLDVVLDWQLGVFLNLSKAALLYDLGETAMLPEETFVNCLEIGQ